MDDTGSIGRVIFNTNLAAVAAALMTVLYSELRDGSLRPNSILVGTMGGLVSVTAGSRDLPWYGALLVGVIAGPMTAHVARRFQDHALEPFNVDQPATTDKVWFDGILRFLDRLLFGMAVAVPVLALAVPFNIRSLDRLLSEVRARS